jgi:hypothetical protein
MRAHKDELRAQLRHLSHLGQGGSQRRVTKQESPDVVQIRDLASGELLRIGDQLVSNNAMGLRIFGRTAPLADGTCVFVGLITPLDETAFAVAMGFVRPGSAGLILPVPTTDSPAIPSERPM